MRDIEKYSDQPQLQASDTHLKPLAVTFSTAAKVSGLGLTSLWKLAKESRIEIVRVGRRTLITYRSLEKLLLPELMACSPQPQSRGRPRKAPGLGKSRHEGAS